MPAPNYVVKKQMTCTREEREMYLKDVGYNIFNYPSRGLYIDFLTDSGTAAISQTSLSALLLSDESYSRHNWYYAYLDAFRDFCERGARPQKNFVKLFDPSLSHEEFRATFLPGLDLKREPSMINYDQHLRPNAYIAPQGRCCEHLLFDNLKSYQQEGKPGFIVSNGIFETTRQNLTQAGFLVRDFPVGQERSSATVESDSLDANGFDGDMDLGKLR